MAGGGRNDAAVVGCFGGGGGGAMLCVSERAHTIRGTTHVARQVLPRTDAVCSTIPRRVTEQMLNLSRASTGDLS